MTLDSRTSVKVAVVLAFALALVGYWYALAGQWMPADESLVLDHPLVAGPRPKGPTTGLFYRPVRTLSLAVDHAIWETNPAGFHLSNVVYHAAAGVLVFGIGRALDLPPRVALLACALYVAHPAHTDAVAPVAGRREVLVAVFYLAAILGYLRRRRTGSGLATLAVCAASVLAIYTKEMAVTLPATGLALEIVLAGRFPRGRELRYLLGWAALSGVALVHALALGPGRAGVPRAVPSLATLVTIGRAFASYLALTLWPACLSADYSFAVFDTSARLAAPALATLALYVALMAYWRSARPLGALALATFALTLAPALSLTTGPEVFAEHTLHLPLAPAALLAAAAVAPALERHPRAVALAAALVIAALTVRTAVRNRDWHDGATLLAATIRDQPACARAHSNLGLVLENQGRPEAAEREYRIALAILPDDAMTLSNLGSLLMQHGAHAEARRVLAHVVELVPGYVEGLNNLGAVECELGDLGAAERHIREALTLAPDHVPALLNLGMALRRLGPTRAAEAERAYRQAIALDPENASAYNNLGALYLDLARAPEAVEAFGQAVKLQPSVARWQVNLARGLASMNRARDAEEALIRAASVEPAGTVQLECARLAFELKLPRLARHFLEKAGQKGVTDPELARRLKLGEP